uniref:Uncharacterized protein n=1 Tax=Rhizophora mucronata TaxID=61149 RepID=A0A2P2J9H1_RHIMU
MGSSMHVKCQSRHQRQKP